MKCEFCQKEFKSVSSLKNHQRTAKYCLKIRDVKLSESATFKCSDCGLVSTRRQDHTKHLQTCKGVLCRISKETSDREVAEKDRQLTEKDKQLAEKDKQLADQDKQLTDQDKQLTDQEKRIVELEACLRIYKEMNERDHQNIVDLAERPTNATTTTTNNFNCPPLTQEHFEENAQFLSLDHIKRGFQGYAQYALDYPLKGRAKCTDYSRRKLKYKNEDGEIVIDPEMKQVRTRLFNALRSRNQELTSEYVAELRQKADSGEWDRTDVQDLMLEAINMNGEVLELGRGNNSESSSEFVKWVCTGLMGGTD